MKISFGVLLANAYAATTINDNEGTIASDGKVVSNIVEVLTQVLLLLFWHLDYLIGDHFCELPKWI